MKKLIFPGCFIALFTLGAQAVQACSCGKITGRIIQDDNAPQLSAEEVRKWRLEQTKFALFIGSVIKIEKVKVKRPDESSASPMRRVTVRVEKYWLGVKTPTMIVYTGVGGGDCGVPYDKGKKYFFAASRDAVGELLITDICSPSKFDDQMVKDFNEVFGTANSSL
jgi:hypothetical protein